MFAWGFIERAKAGNPQVAISAPSRKCPVRNDSARAAHVQPGGKNGAQPAGPFVASRIDYKYLSSEMVSIPIRCESVRLSVGSVMRSSRAGR